MTPNGRWCRLAGICISALVHLAVGAAVLRSYEVESPYAGDQHEVAVTLAMFDTDSELASATVELAAGESERKVEPQTDAKSETVPEPTPEPESEAKPESEPEPEPELKSETASEPASETTTQGEPATKPESSTKTESEPEPEPIPEAKPEPKPQPRPKAKTLARSKQKPQSKPEPKSQVRSKRAAKPTRRPARNAGATPRQTAKHGSKNPGKAAPGDSGVSKKGASRSALEKAYLAGLRRAIAKKRRYPLRARRNGKTGVATIYFVLDKDGRINGARLDKSSGSRSLDDAAVETLRRLAKYKPIPQALGRTRWHLRVPIRFALE
ncbi:MAG: energy transducer TonB [Chromatiaceae bacterium]|jgi:protein TonB|nr:energy transducer TonB [Chromatiaceae bacterium]